MVIVGGVVAYLGDLVGRKIGKKKLRVWRLRPMHTAMIGTFVAGMLGTLATILVLAAASEPVRAWIVEGDKARLEAKDLREQVQELEKLRLESEGLISEQKSLVSAGESKLSDQEKRLLERSKELADVRGQSAKLLAQRDSLTKRVSGIQGELKSTLSKTDKLIKEAKELESLTEKSRKSLQTTREENAKIQQMNFSLQKSNSQLTEQINSNNSTIKELNVKILEIDTALKAAERDYDGKLEANRVALTTASNDLKSARAELININGELEMRRDQNTALFEALDVSRKQPLIYNALDEVARLEVSKQISRAQATALLNQAFRKASDSARTRGSARGAEGSYLTIAGVIGTKSRGKEDQFEEAVNMLTARDSDQVVIVSAFANLFKNEPAIVQVAIRPNPLVYREGDVILEMQVDGTLSQELIINQVLTYLEENLYSTATKKGMIPAIGSETPIGEVTREQILDMAGRIEDSKRRIRLQLFAARDTRASDKLKLDYRLRL